ncbi:response regulator [Sphaerospermopsis aphanizomenoides BCCUSP55]|uniref:response regulator n=1 Tax=Sphaerospermopsis aphanizomenoides TaxID=459663 RepID=UPI001907ED4E|nr:response regulator [Sphaerospermopsis aphanizomenoides]MBK1990136.1 response regulator [Sphaerospermopsis aphanizomenoides BCCUSP55]
MRILLVEDDTLLSKKLAQLLTENNYSVDLATNGQTGLTLAIVVKYDLILLDWLMPQLDGISLCRQLRSLGYTKPILLLTVKNRYADIVAGLDAGADDYITKPYNEEALLATIRSLLRRSIEFSTSKLTWGNLCLDQISGKVTYLDQIIALTPREYNLLELFLQHPNRLFSRKVILDRLWGFDDAPGEKAVTTHIKDLRKKLKTGGLAEDILETVYGIGYRLKLSPNEPAAQQWDKLAKLPETEKLNYPVTNKPRFQNLTSVYQVLEQFQNSFSEQVEILEQAKTELLAGNWQAELQQTAKKEAHKLAGSMETFGYPKGSRLARALEHLLIQNSTLTDTEITRFCQIVTALRQELTKPRVINTTQRQSLVRKHHVLVIDDDTILTTALQIQAEAWGMEMTIAPNLATARDFLSLATPDAVLLDLNFPDTEEDGITLLQELLERTSELPIIVFTVRDSLADRLMVSRLGARQFLHKPATNEQIFQALTRILSPAQPLAAKVLIVDDDPVMLAGLSALLTPCGLNVITLSQPQDFWQVLTATSPDLVMLDLEMPVVNGLELCRVVRQDAQRGNLPVSIVTVHNDTVSLQQAFASGADDFITKPIVETELVTRIFNLIQRRRYTTNQIIFN